MAKMIIAPVKAPMASLKAALASTGTLRITAVLAFHVLVAAMKRDVNDSDKAGNDLDKASHDESQLADPGTSTRRQLRYCAALSAIACRRRDGADRKGAR